MLNLGLGLGASTLPEMYYFFYGTLQHPERLRRILGLDPDQPLPESRPARIRQYRTSLWGEYPALVRSDQFLKVAKDCASIDEVEPDIEDDPYHHLQLDVVPGHVVRLNPDLYEHRIQQYETSNYSPQFVQVEILKSHTIPKEPPAGPRRPRRKRASTVRFDVPDPADIDAEMDDADADVDADADAGTVSEWETDFAKTFVWVGDLSLLRPGRWSLVRWVDQQANMRRGGLQFVRAE